MEEYLHSSQDNWWAGVLEPIFEQVHDIELLLLILGVVLAADVQDNWLTPLVEIFNPVQQRDDKVSVNVNTSLVCSDFINRFDRIDYDKRIIVSSELIDCLQEFSLFELTFADVVKLNASNNSCLLHIWVHIVQTFL